MFKVALCLFFSLSLYAQISCFPSCAGGGGSMVYPGAGVAVSTGSAWGSSLTTAVQQIRPCEIVIGNVGTGSVALSNDNDAPSVCGNVYGASLTVTKVECYADAGTPTITPIITGGAGTSILTGALTCGTGSFTTGTLNGTPAQPANGTIDGNITTAGGTAKYIIMRITRTL